MTRRLWPLVHACPPVARRVYRARYGPAGAYLADASRIPSWLGREEALALAHYAGGLPPNAVIVEIGSFLGKSAIVLAGARKQQGSGRVHCVDPFDANIARVGLTEWVEAHQGTAASVAAGWAQPVDMLFVDGDQSPKGARLAFDVWEPFLKVGGIIALHNSTDRVYATGHDGIHLLAVHLVRPPRYSEIRAVETTTFARKLY